jgi:hypothetical protein
MPNPIAMRPAPATRIPTTNKITDITLRPGPIEHPRGSPRCYGYQRILILFRAVRNDKSDTAKPKSHRD